MDAFIILTDNSHKCTTSFQAKLLKVHLSAAFNSLQCSAEFSRRQKCPDNCLLVAQHLWSTTQVASQHLQTVMVIVRQHLKPQENSAAHIKNLKNDFCGDLHSINLKTFFAELEEIGCRHYLAGIVWRGWILAADNLLDHITTFDNVSSISIQKRLHF